MLIQVQFDTILQNIQASLFPKPGSWLGLICSFLQQDSFSTEPSKRGDFNILVARKKSYAHPDRQLKSQIELSILSHFQKNKQNHCSSSFPPALKCFSKIDDGKMGRWDKIKNTFRDSATFKCQCCTETYPPVSLYPQNVYLIFLSS